MKKRVKILELCGSLRIHMGAFGVSLQIQDFVFSVLLYVSVVFRGVLILLQVFFSEFVTQAQFPRLNEPSDHFVFLKVGEEIAFYFHGTDNGFMTSYEFMHTIMENNV